MLPNWLQLLGTKCRFMLFAFGVETACTMYSMILQFWLQLKSDCIVILYGQNVGQFLTLCTSSSHAAAVH